MTHHVFVYGTLKRGHGNHRVLDGSTCLGPAWTDAAFTMRDLGAFPAVYANGETSIHGEVYAVDDSGLARLDRLEGHPGFYQRERVAIAGIVVWVYLMNDIPTWRAGDCPVIESGVWW